MRRYQAKRRSPKACDYDYAPEFISTTTVIEPEPSSVCTGLLDKHGNDIYAVDQMGPIGFIELSERDD
jgi:hypothetical protein